MAAFMTISLVIGVPAEAKNRRKSEVQTETVQLRIPEPQIGPGMASNDQFVLSVAFRTAVKRIHEHKSCQELFLGLNLDGIRALSLSHYHLALSDSDQELCRRGAKAVTGIGRAQTRICTTFSRLSRNAKAAILIHEALHTAGLAEAPQSPDAQTSVEITHRVKAACAL